MTRAARHIRKTTAPATRTLTCGPVMTRDSPSAERERGQHEGGPATSPAGPHGQALHHGRQATDASPAEGLDRRRLMLMTGRLHGLQRAVSAQRFPLARSHVASSNAAAR